ncbi:MAG: hypothetical protein WBB00_09455, partial [Mycobacterium sp.]
IQLDSTEPETIPVSIGVPHLPAAVPPTAVPVPPIAVPALPAAAQPIAIPAETAVVPAQRLAGAPQSVLPPPLPPVLSTLFGALP